MAAPIRFENVSMAYDENPTDFVIRDLNLEIEESEFFCLLGASGGGKSTVLKMMAGLEKPSKGTLTKPEHVGMVFQSGALLPWMTVGGNVSFAARMRGFDEAKVKRLTDKYIEMVHLEAFVDRYPRDMSGGQRQRVGIARGLVVESDVLILDEPFSALDPLITDELHSELLQIWQKTKRTMIMVSHNFSEAVDLADRIGIIVDGRISKILTVGLPRPRTPEQDGYVALIEQIRSTMRSASSVT